MALKFSGAEGLANSIHAFLGVVERRKHGNQTLKATRDAPSANAEEDVGEGSDDRVERSADHDADGEVEGVATIDKGFEVLPKAFALLFEFALFLFLRHKIVPFFLDLQMNGNTIGPPYFEFNAENSFFPFSATLEP